LPGREERWHMQRAIPFQRRLCLL